MKTSEAGLAFVAQEEGTVLHVYKDPVGIPTIGVGHVVRPGESFPNGITKQQALEILAKDIGIAEHAVNTGVKVPISQNQFDAMVSFTFNCGGGAFKSSGLLARLNEGKYEAAADEFLKWVRASGQVLPGLVARRKRERAMFMKDVVMKPSAVAKPSVPGESAGEKLIRLVKAHVGVSLVSRKNELGTLVARGVDTPEAVVGITTNCATTALGIMALAGVKHSLLSKPYVNGMAVAWVRQIAQELGALVKYDPKGPKPKAGALLRYVTAGKNDDHVEWLLSDVAADGTATHAGGGRADNAVTEATGNVLSSWGRPLVEWIDPDKLGIDVVAALPEVAEPEPEPVLPEPTPVVVVEPAPEPTPTPGPIVPVPPKPSPWLAMWNFFSMLINLFMKRGQ